MKSSDQPTLPTWTMSLPNLALRLILLLTILCVFVPLWPSMPGDGLDPSWVFALNQAVEQKLAFGRDVMFTFGPYSSIYTRTFHPATDGLMLVGSLILAICYIISTLILTNDSKWHTIAIFILILGGLMGGGGPTRDALLYSYPLIVAAGCPKLTRKSPDGVRTGAGFALISLLMLPFGLLVLVKGTLLVACAAIAILVAILFADGKNWPLAISTLVAPIVGLVTFWAASGQKLTDLPEYFDSMFLVISGYTEAFALPGSSREIVAYMLASGLLLSVILMHFRDPMRLRAFFLLIFSVCLFLAFKGGFVRHDGHANIAADTLLLAALFMLAYRVSKPTTLMFVIALATWAYIQNHYVTRTTPELFMYRLSQTYSQAWHGLTTRLTEREALGRNFENALKRIKDQAGIPTLEGTTDIYSFNQASLIASGNSWNPRPVFQSYVSISPVLAERNRQHLLGDDAPDNLVFRIEPIDGRHPATEDGASWPAILSRYTPTRLTDQYLYLGKHNSSGGGEDLTFLEQNKYLLSEEVTLPESEQPIFVRIDARPSLFGKLADLFFKSSPLQINVLLTDGSRRRYRAVSGMIRSEFMISPLVASTADFALLFGATDMLSRNKARSFSVEATTMDMLWDQHVTVSFLKLDLPTRALNKDSSNDDMLQFPENTRVSVTSDCQGHIDGVNGSLPGPNGFFAGPRLEVNGWLVTSVEKEAVPEEVLLALVGTNDRALFFGTRKSSRPDVAEHFNKPALERSGFEASVDVSQIRGAFALGLARIEHGEIKVCRQFSVPGLFQGESD